MFLALLLLMTTLVLVARFADAAGLRPFDARGLHSVERISDPQVAPDGRWVVFVRRVTDFEQNKGVTDLWLMGIDGSGLRRLTSHPAGSHQPRWSPDGRWIYFLSQRGDTGQVWRIAVDGGEAAAVTHLPLDAGAFALSSQGGHLVVALEVFPDATLRDTKQRLEELKQRKSTGQVFDRLFIRHWDTWKSGTRAHLFAVPLSEGGAVDDALVDLMQGMDADCPSKPFGGAEEFTVTPDGRGVVFAARHVGREEAWSTHFDLFYVPLDGAAPPRVVVAGNGATATQPSFSPDGRWLAYRAMARPGYESDRYRLCLKPWPDGPTRVLTEAWDRSPCTLAWSRDSRTLYTTVDDLGHHPLYAVDVATGTPRRLTDYGKVTELAAGPDRVVFGLCHHRSPVELHSMPARGGEARALTDVHRARLAQVRLGEPEQFSFKGWNDEDVYVWLVRPADFDPARKYPVAFLIHGGPQGSFGSDFHYRWNPQTYASAGYAALMVDFHGSTGYGQAFTDAINGHWGDRPLEDLRKGLAAALQRYAWLDDTRVAALGASYGGYMVNWLHGAWPGRFRCLVCHDGNLDERFAYYDTEELWFPEWERGGPPWERPEAYTRHNPIDHVHEWSTPTLVIHGGRDFRVVDVQGIATFTALQRRGVPSRLLYFPDENHWVLKPANSIQWHETVLAWLDQWCRG